MRPDPDDYSFGHFYHSGKVVQTHLRSHAEHDNLQKRNDECFKLKTTCARKILREKHGSGNSGKDPDRIGKSFN